MTPEKVRATQLEQITEAAYRANTEKDWYAYEHGKQVAVPVRFADVLFAITRARGTHFKIFPSYDVPGHIAIGDFTITARWDLKLSLDQQSDEVLAIVHILTRTDS